MGPRPSQSSLPGRHSRSRRMWRSLMHAGTAMALVMIATGVTAPAHAQTAQKKDDLGTRLAKGKDGQFSRMVLEADLVTYDRDHDIVIATGSVRIFYEGRTLNADKVTFYRTTRRVLADGNARVVNSDGTVMTGTHMDVTQNFQDGFVKDLRIETIERSRFAASESKRSDNDVTVFDRGVYTACQSCIREPEKPPFWQIKAAKIIHKQQEQMVYYEDAKFELFGQPIMWLPYFSHPDPSVTRKTGFLPPVFISSQKLGFGARVPYFWAPTPDWDVTLSPTALSRQGLLMDVMVRHKTENGMWSVQAMGINQNDGSVFESTNSQHDWRGAFHTEAKFNINQNWSWGWDASILSDRRFAADYKYSTLGSNAATSTIYLTGVGQRNYFDARIQAYQVFSDDDPTLPNNTGRFLQDKQAVAGTIDYNYIHEDKVLGGEASADFNLTLLDRSKTDLDKADQLRGAAGTYSRASVDAKWRREIIDGLGQVWKPFLSARGDFFFNNNTDSTNVPWVSDSTVARFMPTAGLEYHYPILITSTFGNQIVEPIAQLVARTNETSIGRLPNNDAQSLVFDDTTLFQADKFSGWDRVEGGVRANLGLQYTFLAPGGASLSALFGRSYHLAGTNSYDSPVEAMLLASEYSQSRPLTGIGSGLDTEQSDWVSRLYLDTAGGMRFGTQARFDGTDFQLNRLDVQTTGTSGPFTASVTYTYQRTPEIVYTLLQDSLTWSEYNEYKPARIRQEVQTAASVRATENWRLYGSMRYDVVNHFVVGSTVGLGYDNDSFSASLTYIIDTDSVTPLLADGTRNISDRTIYLRFGLRTLGEGTTKNSLATN